MFADFADTGETIKPVCLANCRVRRHSARPESSRKVSVARQSDQTVQTAQTKRGNSMQVSTAMCNRVKIATPNQSIREAARLMAQIDAGVLPVGENDRLAGMLTDRDIAIRAVAAGKGPDTPVREVMTMEVKYCFEDDDLEDVAQEMAELKVRRMPVLNHDKRLVGILSLGDIARAADEADTAGNALTSISEPGGEHCQSVRFARSM